MKKMAVHRVIKETLDPRKAKKLPVKKQRKISPLHKPENMSLEEWQLALRKQIAAESHFIVRNLSSDPVFSDYTVRNTATKNTYRVAIRGSASGENYCECLDYATNTLGTCKHIEFLLAKLRASKKTRQILDAGFHPEYAEIYLRYGLERKLCFRAGIKSSSRFKALASEYFDENGVLRPDKLSSFHLFHQQLSDESSEVRFYPDAFDFVVKLRDLALLRQKVDELFPNGIESGAFEKLLKVPLFPYQKEGALFAARAGRSMICDDMGLGKTIQGLAVAEILARAMDIGRVLIVCPTSLKYQWQQEVAKFTNRDALVIEGGLIEREKKYRYYPAFFKITNYDALHRDLQSIHDWNPELIVLDEAQRIKNWKTRTARSTKKLNSDYVVVLTGTPLENRIEELHSIVEFIDRHMLGPRYRFLSRHQIFNNAGRTIGFKDLDRIAETLKPILIRRLKHEVLDQLPERTERQIFIPLLPRQVEIHEENKAIVARIVAAWRRRGFLTESEHRRLMIALQNMRMVCNSSYLIDPNEDLGLKIDEAVQRMLELLQDPTARIVVFSQWIATHELIAQRLQAQKLDYVLYNGSVPSVQRKELIRQFKEDPTKRIFLSTDAGGVGLNLQHACAAFIMDQPWNPAVLEQRIGRLHRMGQKRNVQIFHFVAKDSIEEGMLKVLRFKRDLFAGVLDEGAAQVMLDGTRMEQFMKSVQASIQAIDPAIADETPEPPGSVLSPIDQMRSKVTDTAPQAPLHSADSSEKKASEKAPQAHALQLQPDTMQGSEVPPNSGVQTSRAQQHSSAAEQALGALSELLKLTSAAEQGTLKVGTQVIRMPSSQALHELGAFFTALARTVSAQDAEKE